MLAACTAKLPHYVAFRALWYGLMPACDFEAGPPAKGPQLLHKKAQACLTTPTWLTNRYTTRVFGYRFGNPILPGLWCNTI